MSRYLPKTPPCRLCGSPDDPRFHPDRCPARYQRARGRLHECPIPTEPCDPDTEAMNPTSPASDFILYATPSTPTAAATGIYRRPDGSPAVGTRVTVPNDDFDREAWERDEDYDVPERVSGTVIDPGADPHGYGHVWVKLDVFDPRDDGEAPYKPREVEVVGDLGGGFRAR